jgi:DNA-binding winged helix-turn-helix (wHTH) protein
VLLRQAPDGSTQRRRITQPLLLRVLGAERLTTAAGAPLKLPRKAALDILVLLAVHPDGLHRDRVLEAVWPDVRHNAAVSRLHTTISSLRTAAAAITATPIIVRTSNRYQLNPAAINVDLWQLLHHHHAAAARQSTPDQKTEHWRAVIRLATSVQSDHPIPDHMTLTRPITDGAAQAQTRPAESHQTDPTINRTGGPTTGPAYTLAPGMTWPWLHPHRRSLHNTVTEALSHLRGRASAANRPQARATPRSATRSTPGSSRRRTGHDIQP